MKTYRKGPSAAELKALLEHDAGTGVFTWKAGQCAGDVAGYVNDGGYLVISVGGAQYRAHRIAWAMHYGEWPLLDIDHINRDTRDNRMENLRQATVSQNLANSVGHGASGFKGVQRRGASFRAYIKIRGKYRSLGTFKTVADAQAAYQAAAIIGFGEFARA